MNKTEIVKFWCFESNLLKRSTSIYSKYHLARRMYFTDEEHHLRTNENFSFEKKKEDEAYLKKKENEIERKVFAIKNTDVIITI